MLTRLANEFFRAQPGQGFPTTVAPFMPDAQDLTPNFETRLPEFGMPLPSMPGHTIGRWSSHRTGCARAVDRARSCRPSPWGQPPRWLLPAAAPVPEAGMLQHDPRSASAGLPVSPFSLPMPEFGGFVSIL